MPKIFHFFSSLLHTIDRTMEQDTRHRWTDHVDERKHMANQPYEKNQENTSDHTNESKKESGR